MAPTAPLLDACLRDRGAIADSAIESKYFTF